MKKVWYSIIVIFLISCEKNIDFKLQDSQPTLVVNAEIENGAAPRVELTKSVSYFSKISLDILSNSFVHDAEVYLSNGQLTQQLKEYSYPLGFGYSWYYYGIDSSALNNAFVGELNKSYQLKIVLEGKEYFANTEIPALNVLPDSFYFKSIPQDLISNKRLMFLKNTDPKGLGNYLRYFTKKNSEPFFPGPNSVFTDEIIDGTTYTVQLEPGINRNSPPQKDGNFFHTSDTVTLKFCNINRATYTFWNTWEFSNQAIGNPFSQPNKVLGNISNGALGSFCGYAAWYKTIVVQ